MIKSRSYVPTNIPEYYRTETPSKKRLKLGQMKMRCDGFARQTGGQVLCLNVQGNVDLSLIKNIRLSRISESFQPPAESGSFQCLQPTPTSRPRPIITPSGATRPQAGSPGNCRAIGLHSHTLAAAAIGS